MIAVATVDITYTGSRFTWRRDATASLDIFVELTRIDCNTSYIEVFYKK